MLHIVWQADCTFCPELSPSVHQYLPVVFRSSKLVCPELSSWTLPEFFSSIRSWVKRASTLC